MRPETKFANVASIVNYVAAHPSSDQRYTFSSNVSNEWDDPVAGKAWNDTYNNLDQEIFGSGRWSMSDGVTEEQKETYRARRDEMQAARPADHVEHYYSLIEAGRSYHASSISLAPELGKQIEDVWTKKPAYRGSTRMVTTGTMTLNGILKRLGADQSAAIKAARETIAADLAKNARNWNRKQISASASALYKSLIDSKGELNLHLNADFFNQLQSMTNLELEQ